MLSSPLTALFLSLALLMGLVLRKASPILALLAAALCIGVLQQMPMPVLLKIIGEGVGKTMGNTALIIALGAMLGRVTEELGAAQKVVTTLAARLPARALPWALLLTALLAGIPLFYNAGFVVLVPLVGLLSAASGLPLLRLALPMAAALSVTHGFLPPHPGPVALCGIFGASMGSTLLYGLVLALPVAAVAGVWLPQWWPAMVPAVATALKRQQAGDRIATAAGPGLWTSLLLLLLPVLLVGLGTVAHNIQAAGWLAFLEDPLLAMLLSLAIALLLPGRAGGQTAPLLHQGLQPIAVILLIIAAGGAFKEVLVATGAGKALGTQLMLLRLPPLVLGWLLTALLRLCIGSATVAGLTAAALVLPLMGYQTVRPELMVLSIGAGSLFGSHVNDSGFWMFKEYLGLTLRQTFQSWTLMETMVSVLGLLGVLGLERIVR